MVINIYLLYRYWSFYQNVFFFPNQLGERFELLKKKHLFETKNCKIIEGDLVASEKK